ncbi:hypothetical protein L210DRAFT_3650787 [Boletus edulis BED1]|uniref:ER transporter 6TM N-terminal domain-containing protein n=1 Tax=Boletus edulis BED1 TaxID=1328754 RepID=A0AAD4BJ63_BOLED|nr:hypothetical protein L210DRAFT_3650787 [Boletus edulis BED1]
MPEDEQKDRFRSLRPHLHVRIQSQEAQPITVHPATPHSLNNTSADATHKEKTLPPNAYSGGNDTTEASPATATSFWHSENLPHTLQWIPANWSWSKWKPVLRSALAAWISLLLFLIPTTIKVMGQAAFLIIIASFLSPPSEPFIVMLQRELGILTFAVSSWAWSCLGIKLADIVRSTKDPMASSAKIITGQYIEPLPTVIMAIFLFVGSFFFLYIKSRMVPGPLTFTYLFSCMLCMDMSLTIAALYPYPNYTIGRTIVLPLIFHSAISLTLSLCFFPTSGSAMFTMRLQDVLSSLVSATKEHRGCLQQDVTASNFTASPTVTAIRKAESALAVLSSAARLQKFDIIYSRFAPTDYSQLHSLARGLVVKAGGMSVYYTLIDPTRERFPITPVPSIPATPAWTSPSPSRPPSPGHDQPPANTEKVNDHGSSDGETKRHPYHRHHSAPPQAHHHTATHHRKWRHLALRQTLSHHSSHSHSSFLHLALSRATRTESAVGVFESLNYLNLEATHLYHPEAHVARANELLSNSCQDLLESCEHGLEGACDWLGSVRANLFNFWVSREEKKRIRTDRIKRYGDLHHKLSLNLNEFIDKKRLTVLHPYRAMFASVDDTVLEHEIPSHRHLFHCYVYQYHLMRFATSIQDVLSEIVRLETERESPRVWFTKIHWSKLVHRSTWEPSETVEGDDDENPDVIPGLEMTDLGQAVRRDPDALPPRNALEKAVNWLYHIAKEMGGGNALFALKAAILTIILSLPSFVESSAGFAYRNKFVWAVIMAQLTGARFRGDTTFGLMTRVISTLVGGTIGAVMWYISAGNPIGLAAVCLVCFPIFFFFRLYWPVPPMTNLIIWVTTALVVGYSWQDTHLPPASSPGYGITIAWKRFVLVVVGVLAASTFSFLPPSTTIRLYERKTLSTATAEIGSVYCSIISFAHTKREGETAVIVQRLLAILNKLKRSIMLKENAMYEFSLRGKWPAERYQRILELLIQILNLLSHLTSVLEHMEPAWAHAFLKRTRLSDADFEGDVLAVISLISFSLRTGKPLPQVTPCPLLNRFMERRHGLNIVHEESEEDFGLPKVLAEETLESLQYMNFCVGLSTAFSIMTRLDKLMVAVKELVGERYHIDGVGLPLHYRRGRGVEMRTPVPTLPESNAS